MRVELGERGYPIEVVAGGLEGLGAAVRRVLAPRRAALVTNPTVGALYAEAAAESLRSAGIAVEVLEIPDGEAHKTVDTWRRLVDGLLALGVDRATPVVALGGGVTGDIAGFAAATTLRGLPFVQVPTTLLAMVDASVGGKTGVNHPAGKNLVGAFHQPALVHAALATLDTLEPAEYRAGLGEVVKHGLLADPAILELCERRPEAVLARDPAVVRELVERSCAVKAAVVAEDERESGRRAVLNLGHTAGHALESALGHGTWRHGECVAVGLVVEARLAARHGRCPADLPDRVCRVLAALGLPTAPPRLDRERVEAALSIDKKRDRGTLRLPVLEGVGRVRVDRASAGQVEELRDLILEAAEAPCAGPE